MNRTIDGRIQYFWKSAGAVLILVWRGLGEMVDEALARRGISQQDRTEVESERISGPNLKRLFRSAHSQEATFALFGKPCPFRGVSGTGIVQRRRNELGGMLRPRAGRNVLPLRGGAVLAEGGGHGRRGGAEEIEQST